MRGKRYRDYLQALVLGTSETEKPLVYLEIGISDKLFVKRESVSRRGCCRLSAALQADASVSPGYIPFPVFNSHYLHLLLCELRRGL